MTQYRIPTININISPDHFKMKFDDNISENYICRTLSKYLNKVKMNINKHKIDWDTFKRITNSYEYIHTVIPSTKCSISKIKPLSRAFFKLIEICNTFNLFEHYDNKNIKTFHLAEGPGGFIEATTFLRNNKNDVYYGMTLIDNENDNVPGWKKSNNFLKKNSNIIIESGVDNKGDLYNPDNYRKCGTMYNNKMDFITADGGFDFSINFNNQEYMATRLIFTEVIYAITMQKFGGSFVIKVFDLFLKSSVELIYLLSAMYDSVYIFKPNTSRIANSEKYIVCRGFKYKNTQHLFEKFYATLRLLNSQEANKMIIKSFMDVIFPYKFKNTVEEINIIMGSSQIDNILTTIRFIENKERRGEKMQHIKNTNIQKCIHWCIKNKIPHNKNTQSTNVFMSSKVNNEVTKSSYV